MTNFDVNLPKGMPKARWTDLYREAELHKAALKVFTRPLFSWRKALSRSHDGQTLYDFARKAHKNLDRIHRELSQGAFRFREGLALEYNLNGRHRIFNIFPWAERIVDVLLYRVLNQHFHAVFSRCTYAYRSRGFGVDPCQHNLARTLESLGDPVYAIKRDIRNYFPSIPHAPLLAMLREWVDEDDFLFELLKQRVCFQVQAEDQGAVTATEGIPFGTAIACFFANLYLTPLDRAMEAIPGLSYFRYADDMLAVSSDRERAREAEACFDGTIAALGLVSKPSHHQTFSLTLRPDCQADQAFPAASHFRHLGLDFRADGSIGLSRDKGRKIRNLFKFAFRRNRRKLGKKWTPEERAATACEIAREIVERGFRSVAIIDYYLKHVDDDQQLRILDRWLAEEVLARAFGNGHKKGNFKKISFKKLREMGLPSLRHRRRLIQHGHLPGSFFVLRTEKLIEKERERLSPRH